MYEILGNPPSPAKRSSSASTASTLHDSDVEGIRQMYENLGKPPHYERYYDNRRKRKNSLRIEKPVFYSPAKSDASTEPDSPVKPTRIIIKLQQLPEECTQILPKKKDTRRLTQSKLDKYFKTRQRRPV